MTSSKVLVLGHVQKYEAVHWTLQKSRIWLLYYKLINFLFFSGENF